MAKAQARAHILEGYLIAIDNIDEVVGIMKTSSSIPESKTRLMDRFGLSDAQSQAIVEMTLGRLTGLETQKVEDELSKLNGLIAEWEGILADVNKLKELIKSELTEIKRKYSDPRRTEIVDAEDDIVLEDLIEKHNCVITMTHGGYIKRQPADAYAAQHRGGKGLIGMTTKEEDFIERVAVVHSHSTLLMFTNLGRVQGKRAFEVPEASRTAKGQHIVNLLELQPDEKVTALIGFDARSYDGYLTMVTKFGIIKRTPLAEFRFQRRGGKIAVRLDEGDELVFVKLTQGNDDVILATRDGMAVRFSESNVRVMGRGARGVRGISLREGDYVTGVSVVEDGKYLVTITENGFGKRTDFEDFRLMKNRGGLGVKCHQINEKTGKLCSIATVDEDDDLMLITNTGTIIRTPAKDVSVYSRSAGGVHVMRLDEDSRVVNFSKVAELTPDQLSTGIGDRMVSGVSAPAGEEGEEIGEEEELLTEYTEEETESPEENDEN